jgi:hypothetical protein
MTYHRSLAGDALPDKLFEFIVLKSIAATSPQNIFFGTGNQINRVVFAFRAFAKRLHDYRAAESRHSPMYSANLASVD